MAQPSDHPDQLPLAFYVPTICTTQADGSVVVRRGQPVAWMTADQLAREIGVNPDTIYRWRDEGKIPPEYVEFAGLRKLRFRADVVAKLRADFRAARSAK